MQRQLDCNKYRTKHLLNKSEIMKWKGAREEAFWQLDSVYSSGFRLSTRFWNLTAGIFFTTQPQEHQRGPARMLVDKSWFSVCIPAHPKGVGCGWVRALCRLVKLFHTKLGKTFLYGNDFVSCWNSFLKVGRTLLSSVSLHSGLRFPFIGTKVPNPGKAGSGQEWANK